jgi:hypothetical protein
LDDGQKETEMTAAEKIRHGEPRFDALRPAVFDPADFTVVDYIDLDEFKDGGFTKARREWEQEIVDHYGERGRAYVEDGSSAENPLWVCDHCGHYGLRYVGVVKQISTGAKYVFGSSCVERAGLEDRAEFKLVQLTAAAANRRERARLAEKTAHYLNDNEDLRVFLLSIPRGESGEPQDSFDFVNSLDRALTKYGDLTDKQAAGLRKVIAKRPEFEKQQAEREAAIAEREANKGPAPEGRQSVEGEVVAVKEAEGYFRDEPVYKMVVRMENGSAVWTTIPRSLYDACRADNQQRQDEFYATRKAEIEAMTTEEKLAALDSRHDAPRFEWLGISDWLRGKRVSLTATFEVSDRDPHFAFGKRPIATIIEEGVKA